MLIRRPTDINSSEITPQHFFWNRREFLVAAGITGAGLAAINIPILGSRFKRFGPDDDKLTPYDTITGYNNYYEFSTDKGEVRGLAANFKTRPWTITVEGECAKPATVDVDLLLKGLAIEDRTYRHRCVEAWSMVVPWNGVPLGQVLRRFEPTSKAKFVEFTTVLDPSKMPGQTEGVLPWPYVEGLRLDEAMHPLTLLVTGIYGKPTPPQNGAPLRLVMPWKYGFKGAKAIVKIRFVEQQPLNTWQRAASNEYGFYANVNPTVDHPRWSQARERRLGEFFRRPTLMFNGYADQVASMYAGMDLRANF
ncbi:MAG: protein-methionine-sulfoxide reductase catalytic subunit MsrP [Gemmatimonadales bacterium]